MSRCTYCRRDLPGFETICQDCLEAGYDRVAHPTPWWKQFRLTTRSLYAFLFVFVYASVILRINRDHHPTMTGRVLLALILAGSLILIGFAMRDSGERRAPRRLLYGFLIMFIYFFLRVWSVSSDHPVESPTLFAFVIGTIAGLVESVRADPRRASGQ